MRQRDLPFVVALAAATLYGSILIFTRLDVFSIDVAGHLASGMSFRRGYYHRFDDSAFLGYIHGLFYPPLEDFILGTLLLLPLAPLAAYKAYLSLAAAAYFTGIGVLALRIRTTVPRLVFIVSSIGLFFAHKAEGFAQGLCFLDLVRVGTTSQILGAGFFFAVVAELLDRPRPLRLALVVTGVVLSHLIMGLAALAFIVLALPRMIQPRALAALGLAGGMSAFFWIPFLAHRDLLIKNLVSIPQTGAAFAALCLPIAILGWTRAMRLLAAGVIVLLMPSIIARIFDGAPWLPPLHYYRFDICGIVLVPALCAAVFDAAPSSRWRSRLVRGAALSALASVVVMFTLRAGITTPKRLGRGHSFTRASPPRPDDRFGRHLVIQSTRPFDFAVENWLYVLDDQGRGPKGLYWESAEGNHLVSSYIASLVGHPVILDHYFFTNFDCRYMQCLFDHFLTDYNITRFSVAARVLEARPLPPEVGLDGIFARTSCYSRMFADGGTRRFRFIPEPSFSAGRDSFHTVRVEPRNPPASIAHNGAVESIAPVELRRFVRAKKHFYNAYFERIGPSCERDEFACETLVDEESWVPLLAALDATGPVHVEREAFELRKQAPGTFLVDVPVGPPRLVKIKLHWFPGFRLLDTRGHEVTIYRGFPHILALARGPLRLEYHRTSSMWVGYMTSIISWMVFAAIALAKRRWR